MKTITLPARAEAPGQITALPAQIRKFLPGSSQLPPAALAADILLLPDQSPPGLTRRLVVLLPAGDIDESALARRVWQLATSSRLDVLYLALTLDEAQISYQRRRLVGLAQQTAYPHVWADINVYTEKNWSRALKQTLQPGDLLVCLADDRTPGYFQRRVLGEQLVADLGVPVYEFGGLQVKPAPPSAYGFKKVFAWITSIALIAAFFWLQIGIDRSSARPLSMILLCLSVLVELYGLIKINEWIG